ncbi:MAG: DUF1581 domain-containing protein [Fuerstiella sp.]
MSAPATIENLTSHDDDYLFFRIPLRGDFEIECDVSGFAGRDTNLWVAGKWSGLVDTHRAYYVGNFRNATRSLLDPPLRRTDDWIRYRAVVRQGVCTTYLNGRRIGERTLPADHDPWVAIWSHSKANGAIRNLQIIGNPDIPAEVNLAATAELPGWLPVNHGEQVGPNRK